MKLTRNLVAVALFAATLVGLGGCYARGEIDAGAIQGAVHDLVQIHDRYVETDETLEPSVRNGYLVESLELARLVDQNETVTAERLHDPLINVADRHDVYVRGDETLTQLDQRIYLRTSDILRGVLSDAEKPPGE